MRIINYIKQPYFKAWKIKYPSVGARLDAIECNWFQCIYYGWKGWKIWKWICCVGCKHAIMVNSGSSANLIMLTAAKLNMTGKTILI